MARILIDTSIIIDHTRQKDKSKTTLARLGKTNSELFVSIITHTESYAGNSVWERKEAREDLETIFSEIKILPLKVVTSEKAGEIKAQYGATLPDAIIAATAIHHKLKLATLNVKDFKKIKGLKLI